MKRYRINVRQPTVENDDPRAAGVARIEGDTVPRDGNRRRRQRPAEGGNTPGGSCRRRLGRPRPGPPRREYILTAPIPGTCQVVANRRHGSAAGDDLLRRGVKSQPIRSPAPRHAPSNHRAPRVRSDLGRSFHDRRGLTFPHPRPPRACRDVRRAACHSLAIQGMKRRCCCRAVSGP